jgi:2'-phosphotransferase
MRNDGFVNVDVLAKKVGLSFAEIKDIVDSDTKQRFMMKLEDNEWIIRANQGHSMSVAVEMQPFLEDTVVCHGTTRKAWALIQQQGLSKMARLHVHFYSPDNPLLFKKEVVVKVNTMLARMDGIEFYKSANNVILSEGIDGLISPKYFII